MYAEQCDDMMKKPKIFDKDSFVYYANIKFENKFDYSKFDYVKSKNKSIVICPKHGEFLQTADKHMQSNFGCNECWLEVKGLSHKGKKHPNPRRMDKDEYVERFNAKHGDEFIIDMSLYVNCTHGIVKLICKKHGVAEYSPLSLLNSKYACRECAIQKRNMTKTKSYDDFINNAILKHGLKYKYNDSNRDTYINRKSKIEIECPEHGIFIKTADKHLSGQGCFECRINELIKNGILSGGYNSAFFSKPENANLVGVLYYLKVGRRFKIGITQNLYNRVKSIKSESKQEVEILDVYIDTLENVFKIEQSILDKYNEHRIFRRWSTELFEFDVLGGTLQADISVI